MKNMISIFDKWKPTKEGKLAPSTTPKANIEFEQYLSDIQHGNDWFYALEGEPKLRPLKAATFKEALKEVHRIIESL